MLASHELGFLVVVDVGPVSEGPHMLMVSIWDGIDHSVDSGGTARDLDVVLLGSTCEAAVLERATKMGDMIAVEGPVVATRPGRVEEVDRQLGDGEAVGLCLFPQGIDLGEGGWGCLWRLGELGRRRR